MRGVKWTAEQCAVAVQLRVKDRLSLNDIQKHTKLSKSGLSVLLRSYPLSPEEKQAIWLKKQEDHHAKLRRRSIPKRKSVRPPGNSKVVGTLSEIAVAKRLMQLGYTVFVELGDNARFDLIWVKGAELIRVQVKTARYMGLGTGSGKSLAFNTTSSQAHRSKGHSGYVGQVDVFAAYSPDLDKVYVVPIGEAASRECVLRLEPPFLSSSVPASKYEL